MPKRAHEPFVIQSSRFVCTNAYLILNSRLPASELAVLVSRLMSGVMRKLTICEILPVTFTYARDTSNELLLTMLPSASAIVGFAWYVTFGYIVTPTPIDGVSSGGVNPAAGVTWANAAAGMSAIRLTKKAKRTTQVLLAVLSNGSVDDTKV